jgi:hypothetical protein
MQIIVQEGRAVLTLISPIQAHDEALRSTALRELTEDVKVFYQDYAIVRVEARDGTMEVPAHALAGLVWVEKGRRYQLQTQA